MSGKPQNQLTLTNGKYFALSWLCSECNDPLCCDSNNQNACSQLKSTSLQLNENRHDNKTTDTINEIGNIQVSTIVTDANEQPLSRNNNDINVTPDSELFSNKFKFDRRGVHIANLNIRHLKPKLDQVNIMLHESDIDILGVCETFLNKTINDEIINVYDFIHERKDREACTDISSNNGGGILIYLREGLDYVRRKDLETSDVESFWIEVKIKHTNSFLVCSVYRPPSSTAEWSEIFSRQIEKSLAFTDEIYLMGDFNIDIKDRNLCNTKWKHVVETNDLHQLIKEPTRITAHSSTIIDHLYTSKPDFVMDLLVPNIAVSDHFPIQFTRVTGKSHTKRNFHTTIQYRSYKKFNEDLFHSDMATAMTNFNISQVNTDQNFEFFTQTFMNVFDKHAPIKTKRVKRETQPEWHNEDIKHASKQRDMYHKSRNWSQYKYWRNKTTQLIRTAKKDFFCKINRRK